MDSGGAAAPPYPKMKNYSPVSGGISARQTFSLHFDWLGEFLLFFSRIGGRLFLAQFLERTETVGAKAAFQAPTWNPPSG